MGFGKNIGIVLLAVYLILVGVTALFAIAIPAVAFAVLALAAGIFLLIGR